MTPEGLGQKGVFEMSQEMPKYKCHKEVRALKIKAIVNPNEGLPQQEDDGERVLTFSDVGYESCVFVVDADYMRRHRPQIGGYYVLYDDGYKSFSPATPFEEGYTLIQTPGEGPTMVDES